MDVICPRKVPELGGSMPACEPPQTSPVISARNVSVLISPVGYLLPQPVAAPTGAGSLAPVINPGNYTNTTLAILQDSCLMCKVQYPAYVFGFLVSPSS